MRYHAILILFTFWLLVRISSADDISYLKIYDTHEECDGLINPLTFVEPQVLFSCVEVATKNIPLDGLPPRSNPLVIIKP